MTKQCSRCRRRLPLDDFRVRTDGYPDSWCREFALASTREWRRRHPFVDMAHHELATTHTDPLWYSRLVCLHVGDYVKRRITEFEQRTGHEAPPHMTALLQIVESFLLEHPEKRRRGHRRPFIYSKKQCEKCSKSFIPTSGTSQWCPRCGAERKRKRRNRIHVTDAEGRNIPGLYERDGHYYVQRRGRWLRLSALNPQEAMNEKNDLVI